MLRDRNTDPGAVLRSQSVRQKSSHDLERYIFSFLILHLLVQIKCPREEKLRGYYFLNDPLCSRGSLTSMLKKPSTSVTLTRTIQMVQTVWKHEFR